MINRCKVFLLIFLLYFCGTTTAKAQLGLGQEIGIVAGPVASFADYGLRYSLSTNANNIGTGIGIVHYINFAYSADCNCYNMYSYFNDHFRVRSEIDYHETELDHYGEVAMGNNPRGKKLRSMNGSSTIFEAGIHLEYFPLSIRDYTAFAYPISPFFSLGGSFVSYKPDAYSTLGPLEDNLIREWQYERDINLDRGITWSIAAGTGLRYKLGVSSDLVLNLQWRYYHSDWLDGLNHDNPQNKAKDMIFWFNMGYIYYLNF